MSKKNVKKRFSWKLFIIFIIFEIIFTTATGPFMLYYGPFENVKKSIVSAIMQTRTHQYLATTFLSSKEISSIMGRDSNNVSGWTSNASEEQDDKEIALPQKHDSSIERYEIHGKRFDGYLLEIKDPTRVKVGYTNKLGKEGERTSQIAEDHNAIAAVNGGGFSDRSADGKLYAGTGAFPSSLVMSGGKVIYNNSKDDNEKTSVMALDEKGLLIVGNKSLSELKSMNVQEAVAFGPALIVNGKLQKGLDPGPNPRTAIGQKQDGTILLLVTDGRQGVKLGANLQEIQEILHQYGAWNAINLDGGSSTTMYYDGDVINNPSDPLGERTVATAIYVER